MQKNQSPIFELGESNIFEEFYELIEKHRLSTSNKFSIEELYIKLSEFDLEYQKFSSNNGQHSNAIVYAYLSHCLYCFLILFKFTGFSDRPFFWSFLKFIQFSTELLKHSNKISNPNFYFRNISQNFPSLWKSPYLDILRENKINFNLYNVNQYEQYYPVFELAEKEIAIDLGIIENNKGIQKTDFKMYSTDFEVISLIWNNKNQIFNEGEISFEMEINLRISDKENNANKLINSLYLIITALSNIEDVKIEFEELQVGSLIAKVRLYINTLLAKVETKAVLETTKEVIIKTGTGGLVSHTDVKKSTAETKKLEREIKLLDKEIQDKPTEIEAKLSNALDLEKKALENEQLKIKNAKEKLEIIDKLSDLATKGILEADEIRIDINGILYLLKSSTDLTLPEVNIDEIT